MCECLGIRRIGQQKIAETANGQVPNRSEGIGAVGVDDEPGDLVLFVGYDGFGQKLGQGQIGKSHLGGYPLFDRPGGYPRQLIARAQGCGAGQQCFEVVKHVVRLADGVAIRHEAGVER